MSRFTLTILLNMVLAGCWFAPAMGAPPDGDNAPNEPIHIEADRMESDQHKGAVRFDGNIEATQGDLIIRADQMTVFYRKNEGNTDSIAKASKNIEKLKASGNVRIIKQDWLASGDRMEFETTDRKVVITGNTKVWQDNNTITGDQVTLYLDEGKSVFNNQSNNTGGRVKAFFYPEADQTKTTNE